MLSSKNSKRDAFLAFIEELPELSMGVMATAVAPRTLSPAVESYAMTQSDLAVALGLSAADVSSFVRAFHLIDDGDCAVERVRALVASPPSNLTEEQQQILSRIMRWLRPVMP